MSASDSIVPCKPTHYRFEDLTDRRFHRLTVQRFLGKRKKRYVWECLCVCGRKTVVCTADLKSGEVKSCGCAKESRKRYGRPSRTAENRLFVDSILRQAGCSICGERDHRCLEFHHINPTDKKAEVVRLISWSRQRLLEEINRCAVLCCNCHLKVHAYGWEGARERRSANAG